MQTLLSEQVIQYLVFSGTAVGMLLLWTGVVQLLSRRERGEEAKSRRMRMLAKGHTTKEIMSILKPAENAEKLRHLTFGRSLAMALQQAGWTISVQQYLLVCTAVAVVVTVMSLPWSSLPIAAAIGVGVGILAPAAILMSARGKRIKTLTQQLPDALDLMARDLKVGHPLSKAILSVAEEAADPIGTELGLVSDQVSYGDDLVDALQDFADRVGTEDAQYLAASIGIQHGTGGDLARVLQVLSQVIRDRIMLRRKIRAISSEGRLTALFLSILPVLMFGFTTAISPDYYGGVAHSDLFRTMGVIIVVLVVANALTLKKLVNFRV